MNDIDHGGVEKLLGDKYLSTDEEDVDGCAFL